MAEISTNDNPFKEIMEEIWKILHEVSAMQSAMQKETAEVKAENDRRLEESNRRLEESNRRLEENDRLIKETAEQMKETDRRMDKRQKELDKRQKALDKRMGYLDNRFGELAEHLVSPGIEKRFNELGYHFGEATTSCRFKIKEKGRVKAEIDILLENGDTVMAVEVKAKPDKEDLEDYLNKMEILRDYRRKNNDKKKIQGAIAGAIFGESLKRDTLKAGLFVIEQAGDTMRIDIPEGFVPREW